MAIQQRDYSMLSDEQLKQSMLFAQRSNNTPEFLGLMAEAQKRAQMRNAAQGMQAGQEAAQQPATLADQVMSGIANLPAASDERGYASGGIVAFAEGGTPGIKYGNYGAMPYQSEKVFPEKTGYEGQGLLEFLSNVTGQAYNSVADFLQNGPGSYNSRMGLVAKAAGQSGAPAPTQEVVGSMAGPSAEKMRQRQGGGPLPPAAPAPAPAPRTERTSVIGTERVEGPGRSPSVPEQAAAAVQSGVMSRDEYSKAMDAYAEGDNKVVDSIFAKSMARDAKRRAELEGENAPTKGWLGIDISGDTRKAIQDAGIALLRSKKPYLDIGEGIAAGLEGYDKRKEDRRVKLELLDKAEEARNLAILAAKQGNRKAAGEFMAKYDEYTNRIEDNRRADAQLAQTGRYQDRSLDIQDRNQRSAAAFRNAQLKRLMDVDKVDKADRASYDALLRQANAAVDKEMPNAPQAEKDAAVLARMQSSLRNHPWMSKYLFNKAPTGKTYSLMDEGD